MKTIGVLGGIGPQATMDFEQRVHRIAQRLVPQDFGYGYPPMVVWYCRHPPVIVKSDGRAELPLRPDPRILDAAAKLGPLCDFLAVACNSAHAFRDDLERAAGRRIVSMIDATLAEVRRRNWTRVGVLTFGDPSIYTHPLAHMNVACETLDDAAHRPLAAAIIHVMEGRNADAEAAVARDTIATLRARGVDGVILGCTEIPVLLPDHEAVVDLINPIELLAEVAVRAALD